MDWKKLALAPVAETTADRNSYGFREGRSCADAVQAAFNALSKPNSATWVLEGGSTGCFDTMAHDTAATSSQVQEVAVPEILDSCRAETHVRCPR